MKCSSSFLQVLMVTYTIPHLTGMASASCVWRFPKTHFRKIKCSHLYMNCLSWQQLLSLSLSGQILSDVHDITERHIMSPLIRKITVSTWHVFPKLQLDAIFCCSNLLARSFLPTCWFNACAGRLQLL